MKYFGAGLSESHKELNRIIRKPELIEQTKELFLEIHGKLHLSVVLENLGFNMTFLNKRARTLLLISLRNILCEWFENSIRL